MRFLPLAFVLLTGCIDQWATRNLGTTTSLTLADCEKLETVTWKGTELWYLTRPFRDGEIPEVHTFHANSEYGIIEGAVTVTETCNK